MMPHRSHRWLHGLIFLAGIWITCEPASAGQDGSPLSIGTLRRLHSEILGEDRVLSVRVPAGYERSGLSYPVLYLLYGDQTEGYFAETVSTLERLEGGAEIPEFIVVGIHNTDRYGDLLPVRAPGQPGGADAFMDFLEKELFPFVESEYRTKPYRLLGGPQAGGPFGLYALARRPALFNAMVLENPFSAPASREILLASLRKYAAKKPSAGKLVFINTFDRTGFQDHAEANKALTDALNAFEPVRPKGLRIWRRHLGEPTFVPALELKQPLRTIFEGFYPSEAAALDGLSKILAYYKGKSGAYGFDVDPPAFFLAIKADDLNRAGRGVAAREILEYGLARHPTDVNFILRLGNMAFDAGELDRAEAYFKKAQEIRPDPFFASRLEAIQRMRRGSGAYFLSEALKEGLPAAKARLADLEKSQDPQVYFDERELNALGYRLLGQGRPEQAVFILELNARRHPDSWNAHDSLGEAYLKAGRTKDAVQSYERSLAINPDNSNAKKMLETLRDGEALQFQAQIEQASRDSGIPGLVFALRESDGRRFMGAVGMSDVSYGIPMRPDSRFYIGSISQSMLAAMVLRLEEKGKLSLDEPVSDFVDFPGADAVTVEMLLDHSSGFADWTGRDLAATDNPGLPEMLRTPQTSGSLIRIAAAGNPAFAPGERQEASYTDMPHNRRAWSAPINVHGRRFSMLAPRRLKKGVNTRR